MLTFDWSYIYICVISEKVPLTEVWWNRYDWKLTLDVLNCKFFFNDFKMYCRWQCLKCGCTSTTDSIEWRYRLSLMVSDGPVLANICIFGSVLDPYVGMSSNQFVRYMSKLCIRSGIIKGRSGLILELCPLINEKW